MMANRDAGPEQRRGRLRGRRRGVAVRDGRPTKTLLSGLRTIRVTPRSRAVAGAGDGIVRASPKVRLGAHFPAPPNVTFGTGRTPSQRTRPGATNGTLSRKCAALRSTAHRSFRAQPVDSLERDDIKLPRHPSESWDHSQPRADRILKAISDFAGMTCAVVVPD
jgi:hypothetical protein